MENLKTRIDQETLIYTIGIIYCAIASAVVWWIGFTSPVQLLHFYNVRRLDMLFLQAGGTAALFRLFASFIILGGSYWSALRWANRAQGKLAWAAVILGGIIQAVILLYMAPFNSTDIFDNISHGRILGLFHGNPFVRVPASYPYDPIIWYTGWPYAPSAYGPLWEVMAAFTARLAGNGLVENIFAFKLLPGLFWAGCIFLVAQILRRVSPQKALAGTLLVAWNPVALFEIWGNAHNDPAFLFWVLLAVWLMLERHYTGAIFSLVLGMLVKYMPVVFIPAAGLIALKALPGWKERISFFIRTAALSVGAVVLAYAPFWVGIQTLTLSRRQNLFGSSLGSSLYYSLSPAIGAEKAASIIGPAAALLTVLFSLWMGYRAMRSKAPDRFAHSALVILLFYLLVTVLFFWPWYTIWLIALVPLVRDKQLRILAVLFSFVSLSKYFIFYPLFNWHQAGFAAALAGNLADPRAAGYSLGIRDLYSGLSLAGSPVDSQSHCRPSRRERVRVKKPVPKSVSGSVR